MAILTVIFMFAMWTSVFPLSKIALEVSPPLFLTATRMLLAGILLLGYTALRNPAAFKINGKQFFVICLLALSQIYLTNALEAWSLTHLTAAKTCFIYSLGPFLTALLSYFHFKEKMNLKKWLGLLIGFSAVLPILFVQKGANELLSGIPFLSWPELAMMGASLFTVYGWILLRLLLKDNETMSPVFINGSSMLLGGLFALGHSLLIDSWNPLPVASQSYGGFVQGILLMTFISNILCYNLYGLMLKKFTATFVAFLGFSSPIFASFISWLLIGEKPSLTIFAATAVLAVGAWLVHSAELKQGYIRKTVISEGSS